MAQVMDSFEFTGKGNRGRYPWSEILDGQIRKFVEGEDYDAKHFTSQVRLNAQKRGLAVRMSKVEDGVVIQAYDPKASTNGDEEEETPKPPKKVARK